MKNNNINTSDLNDFFNEAINECNGCIGPWKAIALFTFINNIRKEDLPVWESLEALEHDYRNEQEKALATILWFLVAIKKNPADWSVYLDIYGETHAIDLLGTKFRAYLNYWILTSMLVSIESISDEQKKNIIQLAGDDPLLRDLLKRMICP